MEYTSTSKKYEEFVPRKSKEEFYRDGEVVEKLYKLTYDVVYRYSSLNTICVLDLFNNAYQICRSHLYQQSFMIKFRNMERKEFSYVLAFVLLQLHKQFYTISMDSFDSLKSKFTSKVWSYFQTFACKHKLDYPIFSLRELEVETDFIKAKSYVMTILDKAISLEDENKRLRKLWDKERIQREEYERKVNTLLQKLDVCENNAFSKAVNINTIFEYAQSNKCSENNREAIRNTLLYLCSNKVSDEVIDKIKNLELGGKVTIQNNDKCQQFFGTITNSDFHK